MGRTKNVVATTVKVPLYLLTGLLSRLFFVAFLPVGIFLVIKAALQKIRGVEGVSEIDSQRWMDEELIGRRYFHQGHTWAMAARGGTVTVGLDGFSQKVIGSIDSIELPKVGRFLKQGRIAWRLHRGDRILPQIAPIEGTVVEIID